MYTQDNHHYRREDTHERYERQPRHDEAYRRNQEKPQRSNRESRTTDLFKQLSGESNDQDMLFNALMLYARENNKDIYDDYQRRSNEKYDEHVDKGRDNDRD